MTTAIIITAAGRGLRAGGMVPKQWQLLALQPVLARTLAAFDRHMIVLVIHSDDRNLAAKLAPDAQLVVGGETRTASVRNALETLVGTGVRRVLIHDAARPLLSQTVINRVLAGLDHHAGVAPALAVTDALWRGESQFVAGSVPRQGLFRAQTPQGFHFDPILAAHRSFQGDAADDVEIAVASGIEVCIVEGDEDNLKLTHPQDFTRAEKLLKGQKMDVRTGSGFDVHAFTEGDHLWLCGVRLAHGRSLLGHSDADVGMHALTDAIYGALALGDIGRHFPPTDTKWKGAPSRIFLEHAMKLIAENGYRLSNCDVTLICEHPKIAPHALAMQQALAAIMGVNANQISVKATTSERLGFTGREEGIAAMATACLVNP